MATTSDDMTVNRITVDGELYFEVKTEDPGGNGFLTERVHVSEDANYEEIEGEIEEAKSRLQDRKSGSGNPNESWHEEFADLADGG